MPVFYPSDHPSTIVRPEERHRSPSARKDELQGRARKSECPKRSVATQVFRISASAARLSAWVTVALTFFCLLFLCQDKKRRWGPVGASPHPVADEGQGPDAPNKSPCEITGHPHSSPCRGHLMRRMLLRPYPDGQKTETGDVGAYCIRPTNGHDRARTPQTNHPAK